MADTGSRRGASNLGVPLMLLTFLLIGGFMYWLYVTAEPTEPIVVEEVEEEPEENASAEADEASDEDAGDDDVEASEDADDADAEDDDEEKTDG